MSDFDPMVPLLEARSEFEARTIVAVLEDSGLEARVFVLGNLGLPHALTPGSGGIPVHVRRSRIAQAQRVIEASREVGASVDWESVDIGDEPPSAPGRAPSLRVILRAAMVVIAAGVLTAIVAFVIGAGPSVISRAFGIALVLSFLLIAIAALLREWTERHTGAAPRESGGAPPDRDADEQA